MADWRRILVPPLILLAVVASLVFTWYSAHSLLMLFAGILFAVFLDACTRGLGYILPLARTWRFAFVVLVLASLALVTMPLGLSALAWIMAIYFLIQTIEGFVIAPLIQKGSANVAPAWTLFAIVLFGAMFGAMGVALAVPLLAIGRIAALRFYVEDWLKDRHQGAA